MLFALSFHKTVKFLRSLPVLSVIDSVVERDRVLIKEFDTAMVYLANTTLIDGDSLYDNIPQNVFRFLSKNDTYDQMKSSASLRYIKDSVLLNKILLKFKKRILCWDEILDVKWIKKDSISCW